MESEGDAVFRRAQDLIKVDGKLDEAKRLLEQAAMAYKREGALKKETIMLEMLKRIGGGKSQEAKKEAPKAKASKNKIDYSKFDKLELSSDEEEEKPRVEQTKVTKPPIELLEAMKKVDEAKSRGNARDIQEAEIAAAKALENASPEVRKRFLDMLREMGAPLPADIEGLAQAMPPSATPETENLQGKISQMKSVFDSSLDNLSKEAKMLKDKEKQLKKLKTFDDLILFMQQSGLSNQEIKVAMTAHEMGNSEAVQRVLSEAVARSFNKSSMEKEEAIIDQIEDLTKRLSHEETSGRGHKDVPETKEVQAKSKSLKAEKPSGQRQTNSRKDEAQKYKDRGNVAFSQENFKEALEHFSKAIAMEEAPNAVLYTNRAAANIRLSEFEAALADATMAISVDPTYVKAWFRKGQALEGLTRWQDSITAYRNGLELLPDSPQLLEGIERAEKALQSREQPPAGRSAQTSAQISAQDSSVAVPKYELKQTDAYIEVNVELLLKESMEGVDLHQHETSLKLIAPPYQTLEIALPSRVDTQATRAKFVKKSHVLKVKLPLLNQ